MRSSTSKPWPVPGTQQGPNKWWFSSKPSSGELVRGKPDRALFLKNSSQSASALFLRVFGSLSFHSWDSSGSGSNVGSFRLLRPPGVGSATSLLISLSLSCLLIIGLVGLSKDFMIFSAPSSAPTSPLTFSKEWPHKSFNNEVKTCFPKHATQSI